MKRLSRALRHVVAAACAAASLSAAATTTVIDFDDIALNGLYLPGDSFVQNGFQMTVDTDFGTVDTSAGLAPNAPSGNATQFYFNSNDGALIVTHEDGLPFNLLGFDAAFVAQLNPAVATTTIAALAYPVNGAPFGVAWLFAPLSNGAYPFATYNNPLDFADFTNLSAVAFFACSFVNGQLCSVGTNNGGQFAIDNIAVVAVPEPGALALMLVGLAATGVAVRRRRAG